MNSEEDKLDEKFFYDFRRIRVKYKMFAGNCMIKQKKPPAFLGVYRFFVFVYLITMSSMSLYTAVLITDYLADSIEAFHYGTILLTVIVYIPIGRIAMKDVDEIFQKLKKCFYHYNGQLNDVQKDIKRKTSENIKFINDFFFWMLIFVSFLYSLLTPLKDHFYPHLKLKRSEIINENLPIPFYIPFEDPYNIAFLVVFLLEGCGNLMIHCMITSIHDAYTGLAGQIYCEMKLLNYSLCHFEERAVELYKRKEAKMVNSKTNLYSLPAFQKCLEECLKEDLIHHKTLLKCMKLARPFTGRVVMMVITLSSIAWAIGIYVISQMLEQRSALDKALEFMLILFLEGVYLFDMCLFNERIMSENEALFMQIYSLPWYNCDKKFCQNVHFMLIHTMEPPRLNENLFNISASFQTLVPIISAAFSYFNILRDIKSKE